MKKFLLFSLGVILLLPGLCSLLFLPEMASNPGNGVGMIWFVGFLLGSFGVYLIWKGFR